MVPNWQTGHNYFISINQHLCISAHCVQQILLAATAAVSVAQSFEETCMRYASGKDSMKIPLWIHLYTLKTQCTHTHTVHTLPPLLVRASVTSSPKTSTWICLLWKECTNTPIPATKHVRSIINVLFITWTWSCGGASWLKVLVGGGGGSSGLWCNSAAARTYSHTGGVTPSSRQIIT